MKFLVNTNDKHIYLKDLSIYLYLSMDRYIHIYIYMYVRLFVSFHVSLGKAARTELLACCRGVSKPFAWTRLQTKRLRGSKYPNTQRVPLEGSFKGI